MTTHGYRSINQVPKEIITSPQLYNNDRSNSPGRTKFTPKSNNRIKTKSVENIPKRPKKIAQLLNPCEITWQSHDTSGTFFSFVHKKSTFLTMSLYGHGYILYLFREGESLMYD